MIWRAAILHMHCKEVDLFMKVIIMRANIKTFGFIGLLSLHIDPLVLLPFNFSFTDVSVHICFH